MFKKRLFSWSFRGFFLTAITTIAVHSRGLSFVWCWTGLHFEISPKRRKMLLFQVFFCLFFCSKRMLGFQAVFWSIRPRFCDQRPLCCWWLMSKGYFGPIGLLFEGQNKAVESKKRRPLFCCFSFCCCFLLSVELLLRRKTRNLHLIRL